MAYDRAGFMEQRRTMMKTWPDLWLELTHDFIQWLFPLPEVSRVMPDAPLLDVETNSTFEQDDVLQSHLRASVARMLKFLGLTFDGMGVTPAANWADRQGEWFTESTHNSLRTTRMLKCMALLGSKAEARALADGLVRLCSTESQCGITNESRQHWKAAVL